MAQSVSKGKTALNEVVFLILMLAILALLNILGERFFKRLDVTSEKTYTLSDASKDLVKNLPDRMNVKLFVSEDLKPPFKEQARFTRDLLSEYVLSSNGKLNLEVISMKEEDPKKEELARLYGVKKSNRGVQGKTTLEIGSTYLGIAFDYHSQKDAIPQIVSPEGLEFLISGKIKQLSVKKTKIAFATSENETNLSSEMREFSEYLKATGYEVISLELKAAIPKDVDALFIVGPKAGGQDPSARFNPEAKQPKSGFSERAKFVIDQFLMEGKAVGIFVDGQILTTPQGAMIPGMDTPQIAQPNVTGIEDLISHYGIVMKNDLVLDLQNAVGVFPYQGQQAIANHPVLVRVGPLSKDHFITDKIKMVVFPYAGSLELTEAAKKGMNGITFTEIAKSSRASWRPKGPFIFNAKMELRKVPEDGEKGPFSLGYSAQGKFKSFFAGKQMIKEDGSKEDITQTSNFLSEAKQDARLVVIANSGFVNDKYFQVKRNPFIGAPWQGNVPLALNIADWLAQDQGLAKVRNKGMQNRPINTIDDKKITLVKVLNVGGVPLLVCLIGLILWQIRRARRAHASIK